MARIEQEWPAGLADEVGNWIGRGPLREAKLGEQLYKYLRDLIASGKFAPGAKLPTEKTICESFRISRPVVREALARLRMENLVISRRGSGSYVSPEQAAHVSVSLPVSPVQPAPEARESRLTNLLRFFELRFTVECDAAYYAALRRRSEHLAAMSMAIDDMEVALRTRTLSHDAHFRFHQVIAEATGNSFFVNSLNLMRPYIDVAMNLHRDLWVLDSAGTVNTGEHQHTQIYQAIAEGRAAGASRAMRLHIDEARRELFGNLGEPWPPRDTNPGRN